MLRLRERLQDLSTLAYGLICALGCFWQIKSVTDTFFNYAITTQVRVELPPELQLPALSVCFRSVDIFDFDRFAKVRSVVAGEAGATNDSQNDMHDQVTIADAFKFTPSNNQIVSCVYRKPKSYNYHQVNGTGCKAFFNVTNFYLQVLTPQAVCLHSAPSLMRQTMGHSVLTNAAKECAWDHC